MRKGLTLVETVILLVLVILALVVVVFIVVVPPQRAYELSYRAHCASNLSVIGKALSIYRDYNNGQNPMLNAPATGDWGSPYDTSIYTGLNRTLPPDGQREYCITAVMWMLVREGNNPKIFVCPSDPDAVPQPEADVKVPDPAGPSQRMYAWDFSEAKNVSYSWQSVRQGANWPSQLIIAADKTPVYTNGPGSLTPWTDGMSKAAMMKNMSQNHSKGEEINVLYADGHVTRRNRADINDLTDPPDCIYTWFDDPADARTSTNVDPNAQPAQPWGPPAVATYPSILDPTVARIVGLTASSPAPSPPAPEVTDSFLHGPYRRK